MKHNKDLHGVWLLAVRPQVDGQLVDRRSRGGRKAGVKQDGQFKVSAQPSQSDYTPFVQAIKEHDSTYAQSISDYKSTVLMRRKRRCRA